MPTLHFRPCTHKFRLSAPPRKPKKNIFQPPCLFRLRKQAERDQCIKKRRTKIPFSHVSVEVEFGVRVQCVVVAVKMATREVKLFFRSPRISSIAAGVRTSVRFADKKKSLQKQKLSLGQGGKSWSGLANVFVALKSNLFIVL